mgnify:FL=1
MTDIKKYYQQLCQEITSRQLANEEGDSQEQTFTRFFLDLLSEAGETENTTVAYDEKDFGTKKAHKINGYAISDNYETVDLFITIYRTGEEIPVIYKKEIDQAVTRITNFFRKATYNNYEDDVAESSPIFEFAHTLGSYQELKDNLVRVNAFILTNGEYKGEIPQSTSLNGNKIFYRILDINDLFQVSEASHVPIEIDFDEEKAMVPCLPASTDNEEYQAYVAIIPGTCLASLYERFGSRLLEQNVRSFLQFNGKINKGIRETIKTEPHMFFAYNNGLAATADHIELDESGHFISRINNLQIVNGGQTTASIYYTQKKDKADISRIYVQMKISVIKKQEQFSEIVSRISKYANTQNKVNDADFTANNQALIEFEKLSRYILTPMSSDSPLQTFWFFERARGQYKTLRQKEGFTKSRQDAFDKKYPKGQVLTKTDIAKYLNAYEEVYEGKKLVIGPHIVARGNEKNYARFINNNLPENLKKINNVYFEDTISKAILFKTADKRYGTKASAVHIGELKNVTVPYTIALLTRITDGKLDLYKIWKAQQLSPALSDFIFDLMIQVNEFIIKNSVGSHYIEWAKKEECWDKVKGHTFAYDLAQIKDDLIDSSNPPARRVTREDLSGNGTYEHEMGIIRSIPPSLWNKIADWGQTSGFLAIHYQSAARDTAHKLKYNHLITETDRKRAMAIYEIVCKYNIELLDEADELAKQDQEARKAREVENEKNRQESGAQTDDITLDLIKEMVDWDRRKRNLEDWKWKVMNDVVTSKKPLTDTYKYTFWLNLQFLRKKGFPK